MISVFNTRSIAAAGLVFGLAAVIGASSIGCQHRSGACEYGDHPAQEGEAQIVSVTHDPNTGFYVVRLEGLIDREVDMSEETYRECVEEPGYTLGSPIPASTISGGPCPPIETVGVCTLP